MGAVDVLCTIDTLNENILLDDYTLLVFDKDSMSNLIYQVTFISGVKEGLEIFFVENEKVIVHYVEGIRTGKSKTFYPTGVVHYEREFKKGVLQPKKFQLFSGRDISSIIRDQV